VSGVCRVQGLSVQGLSVQGLSVQGLSVQGLSVYRFIGGTGFPGEQFCSRVVLELRMSSSPECYFRGGKVRLLERSSESGEDCSNRVLEPCWSTLLRGKPILYHPRGQL
jgi:hypothetical protein